MPNLIVLVLLLLLAGRLLFVWIRYQRIRTSGHDVRWEWPLGRWWRKVRHRRSADQ